MNSSPQKNLKFDSVAHGLWTESVELYAGETWGVFTLGDSRQ